MKRNHVEVSELKIKDKKNQYTRQLYNQLNFDDFDQKATF